ncbi:LysE family translocator [Vibrio atypicus]|uniref:LysE family translocator n=1 Tax=Vibrio atypicus TaxID=558271 RepID=UPI00135C47A9|nr:LysE family translocator [Vibrio atypicus]
MDSILIAMIAFAFVGAVTPGPVNILATSTAVQNGSGEAFKHVVGASVAYALVVFVSGSVLASLTHWLPLLERGMQLVGSGFLIYLAYKIYFAPVEALSIEGSGTSGWLSGSLTQVLNPKAWLVAMSGVSLYVVGQLEQQKWLWIFTTVSLIACLVGVGVWALLGRLFATYLSQPVKQRLFNRTMAIILIISVSMIWL